MLERRARAGTAGSPLSRRFASPLPIVEVTPPAAGMDLATLHGAVDAWAAAEAEYTECVRCRTAVLGARDGATATAQMMLGVAKVALAKYDEAEPLIESCLSIRRALFGPAHPRSGSPS